MLVAEGVLVASYPFWTGGLYSDDTGFKSLPHYWERTFDYLGEQEQPGRVLMLPSADDARYRWGSVQENLFDAFSPLTPVVSRPLPQVHPPESADLVTALNEYVNSPGYVKGTLGPILARLGVRWVLLQNDLDWQSLQFPRPSTYDALRDDPGLRLAATFGRPGENTFASDDVSAGGLGESSLFRRSSSTRWTGTLRRVPGCRVVLPFWSRAVALLARAGRGRVAGRAAGGVYRGCRGRGPGEAGRLWR